MSHEHEIDMNVPNREAFETHTQLHGSFDHVVGR